MEGLSMQRDHRLTHLQRAFQVVERTHPQPIAAADLATLMATDLGCAYEYIRRLKVAGCIESIGRMGRRPVYGLTNGATMPPDDGRGGARRRMLASRPISQFTAARPKW